MFAVLIIKKPNNGPWICFGMWPSLNGSNWPTNFFSHPLLTFSLWKRFGRKQPRNCFADHFFLLSIFFCEFTDNVRRTFETIHWTNTLSQHVQKSKQFWNFFLSWGILLLLVVSIQLSLIAGHFLFPNHFSNELFKVTN